MIFVLAAVSELAVIGLFIRERRLLGQERMMAGIGGFVFTGVIVVVRASITGESPFEIGDMVSALNSLMILVTFGRPGRLLAIDMAPNEMWTAKQAARAKKQGFTYLGLIILGAGIWGWLRS